MIKVLFAFALALWVTAAVYGQEVKPQTLELGRSVRGRSINAIVYGNGKKCVLVLGGIHGNEGATAAVVRAFAHSLERETLFAELTLILVPEINPDGLAVRTRVNANGVDLNRNFPARSWRPEDRDTNHYPGKQPASEPETRAIMQLLERYQPTLIVAFHAALGCVNWDGPAEGIAKVTAAASGYSLCSDLGYETPGSLGQFAGRDRNVPIVSIELTGDDDSESLWSSTLYALMSRISCLQNQNEARPGKAAT